MAKHPVEVFGYSFRAALDLPKKAVKSTGVLLQMINATNKVV